MLSKYYVQLDLGQHDLLRYPPFKELLMTLSKLKIRESSTTLKLALFPKYWLLVGSLYIVCWKIPENLKSTYIKRILPFQGRFGKTLRIHYMLVEVLKVMGNSVAQFHIHRYPVSPDINLNLNSFNNLFFAKISEYFDIKISEYPPISCQPRYKPEFEFTLPFNFSLIYQNSRNLKIRIKSC